MLESSGVRRWQVDSTPGRSDLTGLFAPESAAAYAAGAAGSALVAAAAWRRGSLSPSGAAGAVLVGTLVTGAGWAWAALLLLFFLTSSALSHLGESRKRPLADVWAKGARRDLGQVLANGGLAAALAVLYVLRPHPLLAAAYAGALAAANADTWATELGVLGGTPRMITTGRPAPAGTSGAVSIAGGLASAGGALLLALAAAALSGAGGFPAGLPFLPAAFAVLTGGMAGSLVDSLLGATLQAQYRCPQCDLRTERRVHACGSRTTRMSGLPWLENDGVNFAGTVAGAVVTTLLLALR